MESLPICPRCTGDSAMRLSDGAAAFAATARQRKQLAKPRRPAAAAAGAFLFVGGAIYLLSGSLFAPPLLVMLGAGVTAGIVAAVIAWVGAMLRTEAWRQLWYCPPCDIVFFPGQQGWASPAQWQSLARLAPAARRDRSETSA